MVGRLLEARGRRVDARRSGTWLETVPPGSNMSKCAIVFAPAMPPMCSQSCPAGHGWPASTWNCHRRLLRLAPVDPVGAARQVVAHLEQRLLQQLHGPARAGGLHALAVGDVVLAREVAERELELGHAGEAGGGQSLGGALGDVGHLGCGEIGLES